MGFLWPALLLLLARWGEGSELRNGSELEAANYVISSGSPPLFVGLTTIQSAVDKGAGNARQSPRLSPICSLLYFLSVIPAQCVVIFYVMIIPLPESLSRNHFGYDCFRKRKEH